MFAAALLNSQPMGFYVSAQIVRDAQGHGVEVMPLDINPSDWDCRLGQEMHNADQHALRLGLRLVSGLAEVEGRLIVTVRRAGNGAPYGSAEEVARRADTSRKAIEALAEADAFASLGTSRRSALWEAKAIERDVPPLLRSAESGLDGPSLVPEAAPSLPDEAAGQSVMMDYTATGLMLRQHPLELLRPILRAQGCTTPGG